MSVNGFEDFAYTLIVWKLNAAGVKLKGQEKLIISQVIAKQQPQFESIIILVIFYLCIKR